MNNSLLDEVDKLFEEKCNILEQVKVSNERFLEECEHSKIDFEMIDAYIEDKDDFIGNIEVINARADELLETVNGSTVKDVTDADMTQKIKDKSQYIDALCAEISRLEAECKLMTDKFLAENRERIADDRKSNKVAQNYYKVQNNIGISDAQFMDDKK